MTSPILLTVDLGTTNCKAVAFTVDGEVCATAQVAYSTLNPRDGWYEQRVSDWRSAIAESLHSVSAQLGSRVDDVVGFSLSTWGPGLVLLDARGAPLNDVSPTWQDVRSLGHGRRLVKEVGPEWVGGGMPLTGFPAKLAWAIDAWPELTREAAYAVGVKDYILAWLTGSISTEPSSGPYASAWPPQVFHAMGWDTDRLPPVMESTAVVGRVRRDLAERLGFPVDLPVIAGLNDGAAATLGVGAHRAGDAVISLGTNGVFRLVTRRPITADVCLERSLFRYPLLEGRWACGGFVLSGGSALAWLSGALAAPDQPVTIDELLQEASGIPVGSGGVLFLPYLVGRGSPQPDPNASGAFLGLRPGHRRSHLTRAVLEGVAFGIKEIAETLQEVVLQPERLFITGGGAASDLWRGILADMLGLPARHTHGDSNLGLAVLLTVGLGLEAGLDAAVERLVRDPAGTPITEENVATYEVAYQHFKAAAAKLSSWAE
jgi:xylulokinase